MSRPISEEVARAFVTKRLGSEKIKEMRAMEGALPLPTQCLSVSQITLNFPIGDKLEISDAEIQAMERVRLTFFMEVLYPQQQREESFHPEGCTMATCKHPWDTRCKTKAQEMWQWDDYALAHYKTPPKTVSSGSIEKDLSY